MAHETDGLSLLDARNWCFAGEEYLVVLDATEKVWKQSPESFRFGTSKFIESSFQ
jgi:hypothetical protein